MEYTKQLAGKVRPGTKASLLFSPIMLFCAQHYLGELGTTQPRHTMGKEAKYTYQYYVMSLNDLHFIIYSTRAPAHLNLALSVLFHEELITT